MLYVQTISIGRSHAALVTKQGEVFYWGEGKNGRLGHKFVMATTCKKIVDSLNGVHVKSVSCGEYHTCALTTSGELYTSGDNFGAEKKMRSYWLPNRVCGSLDGVKISYVACGEWHTGIVSTSGQLFTYGDGTFGVLSHGNLQSVAHPKEVESLKRTGEVYTMGSSEQLNHCPENILRCLLGNPQAKYESVAPVQGKLKNKFVTQISSGSYHVAVLTSKGNVYTWGKGSNGQLGLADTEDRNCPTLVEALRDRQVEHIVELWSLIYRRHYEDPTQSVER
ncbi:hypothetical protein K7X08_017312 [Anisodus acutangulus]|uniref:RCC1-like domain-containing protein n=1 Tax=Anisodus acutangulus TaxID=402998 RepID=A0A9Q1LX33_9SOLA|nr:hypothetical protein K7X08_017312 [Anisodus acutangulus]